MTIPIPGIATALVEIEIDGDAPSVPSGATVLLLAGADGAVVCAAPTTGLFRLSTAQIAGRLEFVDLEKASEADAMGVTLALLLSGSAAIAAAEQAAGGNITSLGDALWYGINTISTVGVGDVTPQSAAGKAISSALMVLGNPLYAKFGEKLVDGILGPGPDRRAGCDRLAAEISRMAAR